MVVVCSGLGWFVLLFRLIGGCTAVGLGVYRLRSVSFRGLI